MNLLARHSSHFSLVRALLFCALLLFCLVPPARSRSNHSLVKSHAGVTVSAATREGRLAIFDDAWTTIRERYYDSRFNGVDWEEIRVEFRSQAAAARGETDLYAVLRRMLARLNDPHTRVYLPGEYPDPQRQQFITAGVSLREIAGEAVVAAIERESEAARAGVRAGDEVVSVDGELARVILARRMEDEKTASTAVSSRSRAASLLLDGARDSFVSVRFRSPDGAEKSVKLRRVLRERPAAMDARRAGKFGVIRFNSFTPEIAAGIARALKGSLRNARGVVLDLRDNGGGEAEAMADIASLFLPAGKELGKFITRDGRIHLESRTRAAMLSAADAIELFRGPVVILIGARTASAAEVFAAAMQEHKRAVVIGENTCGCVLGIRRRHTLPDNGSLEISEVDYRTARGARLEGAGISPDETVTLTRRDLRAGHDRAMKHAVELLKSTNWSQAAVRD